MKCQVVEIDGKLVRVQGNIKTEESKRALAQIISAAEKWLAERETKSSS